MPLVSRVYIKTALVYLVLAFLTWLLFTPPVVEQLPWVASVRLAQTHLFVVGWLTQLIFGVAFWLFPRHSRQTPFGRVWLAWLAYPLLNLGLLARLVFEPAYSLEGWGRWGLVAAAMLQWLGACCLTVYLWSRVRTR